MAIAMPRLSLHEIESLAFDGLRRAGATEAMARATAGALARADAQGIASHGISRVPQYGAHIKLGRVDGRAVPEIVRTKGGTVLVDAKDGLAFPACSMAVLTAIERAAKYGVSFAGVTNSHHFGVAADHLDPIARVGMVGFGFGNSPAAMPAWGGKHALFGTNPIAAVFPRRAADPVVIDLALSETARGKLMVAAREGKPIPLGWALDAEGNPTTDAHKGLHGSMLPIAGAKGAMLACMVEIVVTALTGARIGAEADSFFANEGNRPKIGQAFLVIDPNALAGAEIYHERIETLIGLMLRDDGVRLPGARRNRLLRAASRDGVEIPQNVLDDIAKI